MLQIQQITNPGDRTRVVKITPLVETPPPDSMMEARNSKALDVLPPLTYEEVNRIKEITSLHFSEFYVVPDPRHYPEREVLYKAFRHLEQYLDFMLHLKKKLKFSKPVKRRLYFVYLKIGHVSLLAQDWAKALSAYQQAFNLSEEDFWSHPANYFGLGMVYLHFKEYQFAAEAFSRLLYTYPSFDKSIEAKTRLAVCYQNVDDYPRALKYYYQSLDDKTETPFMSKFEIRFNVALCHENSNDLVKAEEDYTSLMNDIDQLRNEKQNNQYTQEQMRIISAVNRQLGWIEYRKCHVEDPEARKVHLEAAERFLNSSKSMDNSDGKSFYYLGRCHGEVDDKAHDAFLNYRQSIDKSEANADTWCSIGALYQKQTQPMDALQAFICAVELDSEHSAAWTDLGELYEKHAQFSDALECFRNAVKYNPCAPEPLKSRILVLEKELNLATTVPQRPTTGPHIQKPLPSLKDAWSQPIPSELRQRQEEFYRVKEVRYRDGSQIFRMNHLGLESGPPVDLIPVQFDAEQQQVLLVLQSTADHSNEMELQMIQELECRKELWENRISEELLEETAVSSLPTYTEEELELMKESNQMPKQAYFKMDPYKPLGGKRVSRDHVTPLPKTFALNSRIMIPMDTSASEIIELASKRVVKNEDFCEIFEEELPPPQAPPAPKLEDNTPVQLNRPTPLLIVDSRRDAQSVDLQKFCQSSPIALIRGLTQVLRMDLSLFSTKKLLEVASAEEMEVRTQYKMPADQNLDQLGQTTWECLSSKRFTTITKYAQYQAGTFTMSLKEEAEKLRQTGTKYAQQMAETQGGKRRRTTAVDDSTIPTKAIKFGTNVDLSDDNKWKAQLQELSKMPPFCRLIAGSNMLSHLGHPVYGMNTVQLYMKVPGSRTPAHQENNCFASVNINVGPGDCEWFAIPYEYWGVMERLCKEKDIDFLRGSYWPSLADLAAHQVPVYRFTQKAGDLVWVGGGCVHWVQATGWCNNIAWNVGPMTFSQLHQAVISYEYNKLNNYQSLVPLQHLAWNLAKNVKFTNQMVLNTIKGILIRSLAFCKYVIDLVTQHRMAIKPHARVQGEGTHYCSKCDVEVFNILLIKEVGKKFTVFCAYCAHSLNFEDFIVLQQMTLSDMSTIYDQFVLSPAPKVPLVV